MRVMPVYPYSCSYPVTFSVIVSDSLCCDLIWLTGILSIGISSVKISGKLGASLYFNIIPMLLKVFFLSGSLIE